MGKVVPAPGIFVVAFIVGALLHVLMPLSLFASMQHGWLIAIIFILLSFAFMIWALISFVKEKTSANPYVETQKLVIKGPFRYSRHPMYVGMVGCYLGAAFFINSLWIFLLLFPVILLMHRWVILREESYMESLFGVQYIEYKNSVRRWL